jgi:hypothetical protein
MASGDGDLPKSFQERLDPDRELGNALDGLAALDSPLGRMLHGRTLPPEFRELQEQYRQLTTVEWIADALSPLGWVLFGGAPADEYRDAAKLAQQGRTTEAEQVLVDVWNEDNRLKWPLHRVRQLYFGDPEREALGEHRQRLLFKALGHHRAGAYEASIPIVLAQMDGICADLTGRDGGNFFVRDADAYVADNETLAGHPAGLPILSRLFRSSSMKTRASGDVGRHTVMHGREVAYDTLANSTKCFVALFTLIEWGQAIAEARAAAEAEERVRRHTGDTGVDESGRRLDRRSFDEAKQLLIHAHALQGAYYRKHRRYTPDRQALDPGHTLDDFERMDGAPCLRAELCVADEGQQHHVWVRSVTGFVLGLADRDGDWVRWTYAGEHPPEGGIDSGTDWRHPATDPGLPDW